MNLVIQLILRRHLPPQSSIYEGIDNSEKIKVCMYCYQCYALKPSKDVQMKTLV